MSNKINQNSFYTNINQLLPIVINQNINNESVLVVRPNFLMPVLHVLKNHINYQFNILSCISGVDFLQTSYRFGVVYDLLSLKYNTRLRVKTFLNEVTNISSIVPVYVNANWWEREVWDMFGIYFSNNPDLRRILTDYGFEGYPLRKDFPLSGFVEVSYDSISKRISVDELELSQEFRSFVYSTPW